MKKLSVHPLDALPRLALTAALVCGTTQALRADTTLLNKY